MMRKYELIAIYKNSPELDGTKTAVKEILQRNEVSVLEEKDWGLRTLPHEKDKLTQGFYQYISMSMKPASVKEVSHEMGITGGILDYMLKRVG
jgi:ribosomal protein S6